MALTNKFAASSHNLEQLTRDISIAIQSSVEGFEPTQYFEMSYLRRCTQNGENVIRLGQSMGKAPCKIQLNLLRLINFLLVVENEQEVKIASLT